MPKSVFLSVDDFFDLGGDSLIAIRIMTLIRKKYEVELNTRQLYESPKIYQLAKIIEMNQNNIHCSNIIDLGSQKKSKYAPIFFIHEGVGQIVAYNDLIACLSEDFNCFGVQASGFSPNDSLHDSIEDMASDYIKEILRVHSEGPYSLCGYCMGGFIAFEIAKQLFNSGKRIASLILINSQHPGEKFYKDKLGMFRLYISEFVRKAFTKNDEFIHYLKSKCPEIVAEKSFDDLTRIIFKMGLAKGTIPNSMEFTEFEQFISVLNNNMKLLCRYNVGYYPGQITFLKVFELQKNFKNSSNFENMWSNSSNSMDVINIPGNHYTCLEKPNVDELANRIRSILINVGSVL